jgi:hypothetical protein
MAALLNKLQIKRQTGQSSLCYVRSAVRVAYRRSAPARQHAQIQCDVSSLSIAGSFVLYVRE